MTDTLNTHTLNVEETTLADPLPQASSAEKTLLIVDDDDAFRERLGRAMEKRGFATTLVSSVSEAINILETKTPAFAIVDLRVGDGNGLDVVDALSDRAENPRVVVLSGYGNIPTAVAAAKAGAIDFLPKPADADDLEKALTAPRDGHAEPPVNAMSPDDVRWTHIKRVFEENDCNISKTARQLGMHRRTLQRMLSKKMES